MSWSIYFVAESKKAAVQHVEAQREPTPEANYGMPREAKDHLIKTIEMANLTDSYGLRVEACGSHGTCTSKFIVEPISFVKEL